jgi:type-F conjugative transfer system pilin assembly protein TrbC
MSVMMMIIISSLFLGSNAVAQNDDAAFISNLLEQVERNKLQYLPEAEKLREQLIANTFKDPNLNELMPEIDPNCSKVNDSVEPQEIKYLIFVSFSMPRAVLKSLYQAAENNGGVLVLRGLKDGSFKATAQYLKALEIGVQINPMAFKQYQVTRVPTIGSVENNNTISGNISFEYAKQKLLEAS